MSSGAAEGKVLQGGSIMSPGLAGAVSDETTPKSGGGGGGGLFDYLISRKLHNNNNTRDACFGDSARPRGRRSRRKPLVVQRRPVPLDALRPLGHMRTIGERLDGRF